MSTLPDAAGWFTCPRCGRRARVELSRHAFPHKTTCPIGEKYRKKRRERYLIANKEDDNGLIDDSDDDFF